MLFTALVFFIILSILVFIHELGHFFVARWVGVTVEEFGFGLPPRIIGKKFHGTMYSLNWLPIGGFVKLAGEDDDESSVVNRQSSIKSRLKADSRKLKAFFWARSKKERAAILLAGVAMNFLLAVGITSYLLTQGVHEQSGRVHIEKILPDSPAQNAGLKPNDVITGVKCEVLSIRCQEIHVRIPSDLISFTKGHVGEKLELLVIRDGSEQKFTVIPRKEYPKGQGPMGVAISDLEMKSYTWDQAPWMAIRINLERARDMLVSLGSLIWRLVTLQPFRADVAGPIGIAQVTGEAVKYGVKAVLEFMSILSLNLAVLNVLPIPALDGGRLLFVFIEKIIGRRVRPAFERSTHRIGMIVLFALILLVSINDILRIARGS